MQVVGEALADALAEDCTTYRLTAEGRRRLGA
jgi:hypothetical protein